MLARSLPASQLLAKRDDPNGLDPPNKLLRCGIDPALNLESNAALLEDDAPADACSAGVLDWNGLVDGVARLDLERKEDCEPFRELTGGNREGTVPALFRRREPGAEEVRPDPAVAWPASKSGKLSLPGDSGIVSRSGVECPLPVVGGPQIWGERPS